MDKNLEEYGQFVTIQGMVVILMKIVPHMVDGGQIDSVHTLEHNSVQFRFHIRVRNINRVFDCIMANLHSAGQNGMIQFRHTPIFDEAVSNDQFQRFGITIQINADFIEFQKEISGSGKNLLLCSPFLSFFCPGAKSSYPFFTIGEELLISVVFFIYTLSVIVGKLSRE